MKTTIRDLLAVSGLLAVALGALGNLAIYGQPQSAPAKRPAIEQLAWIAGGWENVHGARRTEEHWTAPAGQTMLGMSRAVAGEKTVSFEFLRIEARVDGIFYVAHPGARCPGTDFKLVRAEGQEAVFENPQHDFPQRIIYRKNPDGTMLARIEGPRGGKTVGIDFPFHPVRK